VSQVIKLSRSPELSILAVQFGHVEKYKQLLSTLELTSKQLGIKDRQLSIIRLLTLISSAILFYQYYQQAQIIWLITGILSVIAFGLIIKYHLAVRWKSAFINEQIAVNEEEINFLNGDVSAFDNGKSFIQHDHPYSYDLDFFGDQSLYQSLNRTNTITGKENLAKTLLRILPNAEILKKQEAIKELTGQLEWRQKFAALARMNPDDEDSRKDLLNWSHQPATLIRKPIRMLSFILPAATLLCFIYYLIFSSSTVGNISGLLFLTNLGVLGIYAQTIKKELIDTTKIEKVLKQHAFLLVEIEQSDFKSDLLKSLRQKLIANPQKASTAIHRLALLFGRMEHVANVFASPILNGSILFHFHVLHHLTIWRKNHAGEIEAWLHVIGEMETLCSLANFSYNNPAFVFPELNEEQQIDLKDLGHPLLNKKEAITNSIDFRSQRFFILTGSNMSGKSTFLRTVGINMILAGIGAPVFASRALVHPLPVHVSMRLSDSLTDSESYFYAEVKRLKGIMEELDKGPCFVLLDEILRGTNSDDKRNGTIEVIRKMANKGAIGGIATHDLEVCNTTEEYPEILVNKRFEVEIINDELVFDYKLRDGICQNKSASFIMKKMGVI